MSPSLCQVLLETAARPLRMEWEEKPFRGHPLDVRLQGMPSTHGTGEAANSCQMQGPGCPGTIGASQPPDRVLRPPGLSCCVPWS